MPVGIRSMRKGLQGKNLVHSTIKLLMEFLESNAENICMARRRTALDVWVRRIATLLDLDQGESFKMSIPATGGRYLIADVGCKPQVGHNYTRLNETFSPGYFFILNGSEEGKLYVMKGPH